MDSATRLSAASASLPSSTAASSLLPSDGGEEEPATEKAADAIATATIGHEVPDAAKRLAGQNIHYALGIGLGLVDGIAAEFRPAVTAGYGRLRAGHRDAARRRCCSGSRAGVVFIGATTDQHLRAFDFKTGAELWKARLPAGAQATPMTYRGADGRQYVVITAGGHGALGTRYGDYTLAFALPRGA